MRRRKWDSKTKWLIVMEGLKGRKIVDLCTEHAITQGQYYSWRDQFLSEGYKVFDHAKSDKKQSHLEHQNSKLKKLVGELTLELKKNDDWLD